MKCGWALLCDVCGCGEKSCNIISLFVLRENQTWCSFILIVFLFSLFHFWFWNSKTRLCFWFSLSKLWNIFDTLKLCYLSCFSFLAIKKKKQDYFSVFWIWLWNGKQKGWRVHRFFLNIAAQYFWFDFLTFGCILKNEWPKIHGFTYD